VAVFKKVGDKVEGHIRGQNARCCRFRVVVKSVPWFIPSQHVLQRHERDV
jgi:hypothetical protein